ncbi:hypothetical protein ACQR1N_31005 [Bradyrhizobium sp. HKCCYLRH1073]|uniref:hypothetical protein n=1 Tax=unclassified Bradyrhizobium TaxID=2631580 RepID=UPI003EBEFBDC
MKFSIGDATDRALCIALKHEFLRCDEAFAQFASAGEALIMQGQDRRRAYKAYDAYARFIHHLYEFALCAIARDRQDISPLQAIDADRYVASYLQRSLQKRRDAILDGTAPAWENHISAFPESIPPSLATEFRRARNIALAHAGIKRPKLDLSDFYDRCHNFLHIFYKDAQGWWGRESDEFPDLEEITAFSLMISKNPPTK